jgi:uncharacterized membrane protein YjgN (DUF898 family)
MQESQALAPRQAANELPIRFTGSGSEYFRIWIVNLLLTILTLGIYSAWAKVRRLKYFHGNTLVADSPLDYHGTPMAILKGRVIAFLLLVVWNAAQEFGSPTFALVVFLGGLCVLPGLLLRSLRFQFINTSYRGVRFGFAGKTGDAYLAFLVWPLLAIPTLFILVPFAHQRLRRFIQGGVRYGNLPGSMRAGPCAFYATYALTALMVVGAVIAAVMLPTLLKAAVAVIPNVRGLGHGVLAMIVVAVLCALLVLILLARPYFIVRIRNVVWNHTALGEHQFRSRARVAPFVCRIAGRAPPGSCRASTTMGSRRAGTTCASMSTPRGSPLLATQWRAPSPGPITSCPNARGTGPARSNWGAAHASRFPGRTHSMPPLPRSAGGIPPRSACSSRGALRCWPSRVAYSPCLPPISGSCRGRRRRPPTACRARCS